MDNDFTTLTPGDEGGYDESGYNNGYGAQEPVDTPPERYFTQADIDRIVQERLARSERQWQQRLAQMQQEYEAYLNSLQQPAYDEEPEETYVDPLDERLAPIEEFVQDMLLEKEINALKAKYPDFNELEVLQLAVEMQEEDLDKVYRLWKYEQLASNQQQVDIEAIKKQAVEEYLNSKRQQARSLPSPEGAGGAPPTTERKIKTFDDATRSALERIRKGG